PERRVGLFALLGMFSLAIAIRYVTTGTGIWVPKYRLRTYLPEVEGLTIGAPVRLNGVEIGNVDSIRVSPRGPRQPPDPRRNIELVLRIDRDRKSTRLNSSHQIISYAVFCLK